MIYLLPNAESIIVTGRHISAQEALKLGIVDQVTDENACRMAVEFALRAVGMSCTCRAGNIPDKSFTTAEGMNVSYPCQGVITCF